MGDQSKVKDFLAECGIKTTSNRVALLTLFLHSPQALTAPEVMAALGQERRVNKVTVYRMLSLFAQRGVLRKLSLAGRAGYFELAAGPHLSHPHFQCQQCGEVQCLEPVDLDQVLAVVRGHGGNLAERVEIRVEGVCHKCRTVR